MKKLFVFAMFVLAISISPPVKAQVQPMSATLTAASTGVCLPTNCLAYSVPSGVGSATFQIGGNTVFTGTVQFEEVLFDGSYYPLNGTPSNSATQATSATGPGSWQVSLAGRSTVRMRVTVLGSGSVAAAINPSTASAKAAGGSGGSSTIAIPATVSSATSGGIPCFDSATDMNTSAALTNHAILQGGGAGACPGVGNGDFTIDSTAHHFLMGASGQVDLHTSGVTNSFLIPNVAIGATVNGALQILNGTELNFGEGGTFVAVPWAAPAGQNGSNCTSVNGGVFLDYYTALSGNGAPTCAHLAPVTVNSTSQTGAISTATLCAAATCGNGGAAEYMLHWNFWGSGTACGTPGAGAVTYLLTWTDEQGTTHSAVSLQMESQTGATSIALGNSFLFQSALANEGASGEFVFSTNGTIIQYATGYTACGVGTGTYNLRSSISRLQ